MAATMRVSIPGPGGALGECVICGNTFMVEILLGKNVQFLNVTGVGGNLPAHDKCADLAKQITDGDWRKLPDGPLRKLFADEDASRVSGDPSTPPE